MHALAHAMNNALGNAGPTVVYTPAPEAAPSDQLADLRALVSDMDAGRVQMLMIVGESNPALTAPADLNFGDALGKVAMRVHSGLYRDSGVRDVHGLARGWRCLRCRWWWGQGGVVGRRDAFGAGG